MKKVSENIQFISLQLTAFVSGLAVIGTFSYLVLKEQHNYELSVRAQQDYYQLESARINLGLPNMVIPQ